MLFKALLFIEFELKGYIDLLHFAVSSVQYYKFKWTRGEDMRVRKYGTIIILQTCFYFIDFGIHLTNKILYVKQYH